MAKAAAIETITDEAWQSLAAARAMAGSEKQFRKNADRLALALESKVERVGNLCLVGSAREGSRHHNFKEVSRAIEAHPDRFIAVLIDVTNLPPKAISPESIIKNSVLFGISGTHDGAVVEGSIIDNSYVYENASVVDSHIQDLKVFGGTMSGAITAPRGRGDLQPDW